MAKSKINLNKEIIALFSGQSSTITTPKLYIQLTGSHSLASVLNQTVFWSNKSDCNNGFFYKTYKDWFEEINIPERTLRRYFNKLEYFGWLETKVKKVNGKNTKHVRPDMDKIIESISLMLSSDCPIRPTCQMPVDNPKIPVQELPQPATMAVSEPANLSVYEGSISLYTEENFQKKKLTTENQPQSSSSSFFSNKQTNSLLSLKLETDSRPDELFLQHCQWHIEKQTNNLGKFQRMIGISKILKGLQESGEPFKAIGFNKNLEQVKQDLRIPTQEDFQNYKRCVDGFEWVGSWMQKQNANS